MKSTTPVPLQLKSKYRSSQSPPLLRLMLDAHPRVAIPPETGFVPRALLKVWGDGATRRRRFFEMLTSHPQYAQAWGDFGIAAESFARELANVRPFRLDEALRCFYRIYAARFGKDCWGDKTPGYGRYMRAIGRLLPEARFIHMIRDGRDAAVSLRPLWFAPGQDIDTLARCWRADVLATRQEARGCRHYLEIREWQVFAVFHRVKQLTCIA